MILFGVLATLVGVVLIFVVVIQNSKGGGLSSTFAGGSATQMLGARRSSEFIEKATWWLASAIAVLAFLANIAGTSGGDSAESLRMSQQISNQVVSDQIQDVSTINTEAPVTEDTEVPATD